VKETYADIEELRRYIGFKPVTTIEAELNTLSIGTWITMELKNKKIEPGSLGSQPE